MKPAADIRCPFDVARAVARSRSEYRLAQPRPPVRRLSCAPVLVSYGAPSLFAHMPVEPDHREGEDDDNTPKPETPPPPVREPQPHPEPMQAAI